MTRRIEHLKDQACLMVKGPDRPGIVAAVGSAIARNGGNILQSDQFTSIDAEPVFYQRTVFHRENLTESLADIEEDLAEQLAHVGLEWRLIDRSKPKRMIVLAPKSDHCLLDLLWRQQRGELPVEIPMVISNHPDLREEVEYFGIDFHHVPSMGADKSEAEAKILELISGRADFVVLARYMQILSEEFLGAVGVPIINIHHSFLPAFIGAGPYRMAWERGVKLIGATAHYVTPELDAGPIIEQDVTRVDHTFSPADLQKRGAYVERETLSRAVQAHAEDRVFWHGNHAIVF
ncbi:formyltetrahydrofolate deformylase [Kocuria sp. HSID16901]|uniref:formyltetrahydrofolate deformylase n=1 Tax=Kocuria sp. HSID16901 TaxID=2419505 RepID=UPI000660ADC4|nr:formyltetrahydrofolate deformylase [Kocuria sp. HSID16901]MCT1367144.1 formyltetrahydrofolate deformylase [Rothia sp. p3-SID1597]RUQ21847.1 formyltetrahydrofolate deformylase [Kocuria sp. HSID16901]